MCSLVFACVRAWGRLCLMLFFSRANTKLFEKIEKNDSKKGAQLTYVLYPRRTKRGAAPAINISGAPPCAPYSWLCRLSPPRLCARLCPSHALALRVRPGYVA